MNSKVDLSVTIGKLKLKNPVMPSSGTFGYGKEFADFFDLEELGAVVVNRITLNPKMGNFPNRCIEVAGCAYLSTTGQQNMGVHEYVKNKLPWLRQFKVPVIVNVAGESIEEYVKVTEILIKARGADAIEINMACPNLREGGRSFCASADMAFNIVKAVRNTTDLTIIPKCNPTVTDITVLAQACEEAGADAIAMTFGQPGMAIDINTRRSKLGKNLTGALGGPAIKPILVRMIYQSAHTVKKIPVIGSGGVTNAEDALEFLIAGATGIQIGSYSLVDPRATVKTIEGIKKYMMDKGIMNVREIIGSMIVS